MKWWHFSILTGVLLFMSRDTRVKSERNNNPLNIEKTSDNWNGSNGDDGRFVIFDSPEYGFRAGARILGSYARRGVVSLADIIGTWAPVNGVDENGEAYINPTANYIEFVSSQTDIAPTDEVTREQYPALMLAMSIFEGSRGFTMEQAQIGAGLA